MENLYQHNDEMLSFKIYQIGEIIDIGIHVQKWTKIHLYVCTLLIFLGINF